MRQVAFQCQTDLDNAAMKTIRKWWIQFCQQTTLHGWSYIVNEKGIFAKVLWIIAQIVFVSLAGFLMMYGTKKVDRILLISCDTWPHL